MSNPQENQRDAHAHPHVIHYFLDRERQETADATLKVGEILRRGGLDPATHYLVEHRGKEQIEHKDLDEIIKVHQGEKFTSIFHGPTPVS